MTAPTASRAGFLPATGERACGAATAGNAEPLACSLGVADQRIPVVSRCGTEDAAQPGPCQPAIATRWLW